MKSVLFLIIIFILTICIFNYLIDIEKKNSFRKAGKKWDNIVKELSNRK